MKEKEENEKAGLKLNTQETKIMASDSTTLWQMNGKKVETVTNFIFLGSKITVDSDCSHEIKRCLSLVQVILVCVAEMSSFKQTLLSILPGGSGGKASAQNAGDPGSILGLGRSSGEGNGTPLQNGDTCVGKPMHQEAAE